MCTERAGFASGRAGHVGVRASWRVGRLVAQARRQAACHTRPRQPGRQVHGRMVLAHGNARSALATRSAHRDVHGPLVGHASRVRGLRRPRVRVRRHAGRRGHLAARHLERALPPRVQHSRGALAHRHAEQQRGADHAEARHRLAHPGRVHDAGRQRGAPSLDAPQAPLGQHHARLDGATRGREEAIGRARLANSARDARGRSRHHAQLSSQLRRAPLSARRHKHKQQKQ